jgi:hypothetical protein
MVDMHLKHTFEDQDPIRAGFGRGLLDAGKRWDNNAGRHHANAQLTKHGCNSTLRLSRST